MTLPMAKPADPEQQPSTPLKAVGGGAADRDLEAFMSAEVREGRRVRVIPWTRLAVSLASVGMLFWLGADGLDELAYHFSSTPLESLGDVTGQDGTALPEGRYVELQGVLGNKAATVNGLRPGSFRRGPIQVRQLLGSPVFVEFDQDSLYERYQPFTRVTVKGRLVAFGPGGDLAPVRDYFSRKFLMEMGPGTKLLIVGEQPGDLWRYPIILLLMLMMAATSLLLVARAMRPQIVEDTF
jgi:hypothetical protein